MTTWIGHCTTCGKRCYLTKHAARKARRNHAHRAGLSVYPCGNYWHLGHLPLRIRQGHTTRDTIRKKDQA